MNLSELREQRAKLLENVTIIVSGADEEGRPLTDEEKAQVDAILGQAEELAEEEETTERKLQLAAQKDRLTVNTGRKTASVGPAIIKRSGKDDRAYLPDVIRHWALWDTGRANPTPEVLRAADGLGINLSSPRLTFSLRTQSKLSNAAGAYTVPQDFGDKIVEHLKYFCPIRDYCTVLKTGDGRALPFPTNDDTGNVGAIVAEAGELSETDTTFGQATLGAYNYKSMIRLSLELMQDSAFNLEDYLSKQLGMRIGRAQEAHFVTGDNSSKPQGIVTASTNAVSDWTTTYANVVELFYSVDPAYRANGIWLMNDQIAADIRGIVDDQNRPLWDMVQAFDRDGEVDRLLGRPVVISNSMEYTGASKKVIVFGDPTDFMIRDVGEVTLAKSEHRYFEFGLVAFQAFLRSDSKWFGSTRALKCGTTAASSSS